MSPTYYYVYIRIRHCYVDVINVIDAAVVVIDSRCSLTTDVDVIDADVVLDIPCFVRGIFSRSSSRGHMIYSGRHV